MGVVLAESGRGFQIFVRALRARLQQNPPSTNPRSATDVATGPSDKKHHLHHKYTKGGYELILLIFCYKDSYFTCTL